MTDKKTVLVTGITGFIASHVARQLLVKGYHVRGTLRSLKKSDEVYAKVAPPETASRLELREIDLLDSVEKWVDVVSGCTLIQHIASPFFISKPTHPDQLLKPAVDGTLAVLNAAHQAGGVTRVVLTSSVAAIADGHEEQFSQFDASGVKVKQGKRFTDADWSGPNLPPYPHSKTQAERAAWDFMEQTKPQFELAVVNPAFVHGPFLLPYYGTSVNVVKPVLSRTLPALPHPSYFYCVDVRDVAKAHVNAMEISEAVGHRHPLVPSTCTGSIKDFSTILTKKFAKFGYSPVSATLPRPLLYLISLFDSELAVLYSNLGRMPEWDVAASDQRLGMTDWYSLEESLEDMGHSLIELGAIPRKPNFVPKVVSPDAKPG